LFRRDLLDLSRHVEIDLAGMWQVWDFWWKAGFKQNRCNGISKHQMHRLFWAAVHRKPGY